MGHGMCLGRLIGRGRQRTWAKGHVRSSHGRYTDFQGIKEEENCEKGNRFGSNDKLPVKNWLPERNKKELKVYERNGLNKGNNMKTLGETSLSVDSLLVPHCHDGGRGHRWRRKRSEKRDGHQRHSSLCSLNEIFFLFFCVCMVALSVDDGCVSVGRIVRSFGLVCQVCSWGNEKQTFIKENKYRAALHCVCCLRPKNIWRQHHYLYMEWWESRIVQHMHIRQR